MPRGILKLTKNNMRMSSPPANQPPWAENHLKVSSHKMLLNKTIQVKKMLRITQKWIVGKLVVDITINIHHTPCYAYHNFFCLVREEVLLLLDLVRDFRALKHIVHIQVNTIIVSNFPQWSPNNSTNMFRVELNFCLVNSTSTCEGFSIILLL